MPVKKLKEFLDNQKVKYLCITHSPAYTTQEIAAVAHISGKQLAKIVIAKIDDGMAMVVVPAHEHVNFSELKKSAGVKNADLASESDFKKLFPECEVGAMPPFGNLYDMPVYVSDGITKMDSIIFNAGSHSELMQIAYEDFERLVKPKVFS